MGQFLESLRAVFSWLKRQMKRIFYVLLGIVLLMVLALAIGKTYQYMDKDEHRGAIPVSQGAFDESYSTPQYLDQGWGRAESMWFYNTTQGSDLLPYAFFLALEQADSQDLFRSTENIDKFRYLPQKPTFFNPDGLPLGFVKDSYEGKDYVGLTCAACHTGQINYRGQAIRIDGGPAMSDMDGFLHSMTAALTQTLQDAEKQKRFVTRVLNEKMGYDSEQAVLKDLARWQKVRMQYDLINHSSVDYGYARLDAFGRIFNRILQHIINKAQLETHLLAARDISGERLLSSSQVAAVLEDIDDTVVDRFALSTIIDRLMSEEHGLPGLSLDQVVHLSKDIFNEPNAPVSYPALWDTAHADYVQWNGIAKNAGAGPLGRNVGEVLGVFATIDWTADEPWYAPFNLAARASGQKKKQKVIHFKSSADKVNLQRLESHLRGLSSPKWPEPILGRIDYKLAEQGQKLYVEYCQSCHEVIQRDDWDRIVVANMTSVDRVKTDPAMAENSVFYNGSSGNFKHTYQARDVGNIVISEEAPVAVLLTAATKGVVVTPDYDKSWLRRSLDWLYIMGMSLFQNKIEPSVRKGDYNPDTTAQPFNSLLAYKARSLNGIWATAPYLHNGSVPTLYDLLLPKKREGDPEDGEYRPNTFYVGSREFDPRKVGFKSQGYAGFVFDVNQRGNANTGHEYAAGITPRSDGKVLPPMTSDQRWALIEYLKTL